jgi:hypothetical protein
MIVRDDSKPIYQAGLVTVKNVGHHSPVHGLRTITTITPEIFQMDNALLNIRKSVQTHFMQI